MFVDVQQRQGCSVPVTTTLTRVPWRPRRQARVLYASSDLTTSQHVSALALSSAAGACAATGLAWLRHMLDSDASRLHRLVASRAAANATLTPTRAPLRTRRATAATGAARRCLRAGMTHVWVALRFAAATMVEYAYCLALCVIARDALHSRCGCSNACSGAVAGALTGATYALLRYPYDVLHSAASAVPSSSRAMAPRRCDGGGRGGPWCVLQRVLTARRRAVVAWRDLCVGASVVVVASSARVAVQFGVYNVARHDAAGRPWCVLYAYCYAAALLGLLAEYPALGLTHQLRVRNATVRGPAIGHKALLAELRRRHGVTKVYDGFFGMRPLLAAAAPALLLSSYDAATQWVVQSSRSP